jgi:hypothetical protein
MALTKPILFNSGKVRNNLSKDERGLWNVTTGGFTDQFHVTVTPRRFRARLHGYHFCSSTYSASGNVWATTAPHIWLFDNDANSGYRGDLNSGDPIRYTDIDTLREDAVDLLNSIAPSGYTFHLTEDGDVEYEGTHTDLYLGGLLPWILGWGYLSGEHIVDQVKECITRRRNNPPAWALYYSSINTYDGPGATGQGYPNGEEDAPNTLKWFVRCRRMNQDLTSNFNWVRNRSTFAYFYQCDPSVISFQEMFHSEIMQRVPEDNDGNYRLYYLPNNDVEPRVGDKVRLSRSTNMHFWIVALGVDATGVNYMTVKDKDMDGDLVNDKILYLPYCFGWCNGFADALENDWPWFASVETTLLSNNSQSEIEGVISAIYEADYSDPNEIIDPRESESKNLKKLLGEFLGDHTQDAGLPQAIQQSTFWNCFTRESGSRELFDLDALIKIVKSFGAADVQYRLALDYGENENDIEEQEVNIMQILHGLCMTFGARMAWRYSETKRAWFLTFVPYFGESIAQVVTGARVITDDDFVKPFVAGVAPGSWRYGVLSATYKTTGGGEVTFNEPMRDGRTVAAASSEALEISDAITLLPPDTEIQKLFSRRFSDYMREFSQETYTHQASLTMRRLAMIPVGMGIALDSDYMTNRETGRATTSKQYATVNSARVKVMTNPALEIEMSTTTMDRKGIGPAFFCTSAQVSNTFGILTISGCTAIGLPTPAGYASGLPIMGYFGCWDFDEADGTIKERSCTCGNYAVTIWQRNTQTVTKSGASRNCWTGVLTQPTLTQVNNGTCTISLDGGDDTNLDTIKATNDGFVVKFAAVDHAQMQPCQLAYFGHWGSSSATLTDNSGAAITPILIGG